MVQLPAASVDDYMKQLSDDQRLVISQVRDLVKRSLPKGYEERAGFGMITYEVPLERFSDTYNGQPLCYIGLASQKNHISLYLMGVYGDPEQENFLKEEFRKAGKKLDMGKSCLRFRKVDDLPLDVIAKVVASVTPDALIARHQKVHAGRKGRRGGAKRA